MAASKNCGFDGVAADLFAARGKGSYKPIEGCSGVKGFVLALPLTAGNIALVLGRRGPRPETHTLLGTITQQGVRRVHLGTAFPPGHLRTWTSPHASRSRLKGTRK